MTRWYWEQRGGTLIEEFLVVKGEGKVVGRRLVDGLIILGEDHKCVAKGERSIDIEGKDVVAVQAKNSRLGMYLMGQTLFTAQLLERLKPRSIESIALCAKDDVVLRPILESYEGCKVVICPPEICSKR